MLIEDMRVLKSAEDIEQLLKQSESKFGRISIAVFRPERAKDRMDRFESVMGNEGSRVNIVVSKMKLVCSNACFLHIGLIIYRSSFESSK